MAIINGTAGDDNFDDRVGNDTINGLAGNDSFHMLVGGSDTVNGGAGDGDWVDYSNYNRALTINMVTGKVTDGLGNTDTLIGFEGVHGSRFGDTITLKDGTYTFARAGNDTIRMAANGGFVSAGSGNDTIIGGVGTDRASFFDDGHTWGTDVDGAGIIKRGAVVNLVTGKATDGWGHTDTLISVEEVEGTHLADSIIGNAGSNYLAGDAGNDTINGGGTGLDGWDHLVGGAGNDTLTLKGLGLVDGGAGNDRIVGQSSGNVDEGDYVELGYEEATSAVVANFTAVARAGLAAGTNAAGFVVNDGQGGRDRVSGIHQVNDTSFGDSFFVDATFNNSFGNNLRISLTGGNDYVRFIGVANAQVSYNAAEGAVSVDLAAGTATDLNQANLFIGYDTLLGVNFVQGSRFNDSISGGAGNEQLRGRDGNDILMGRAGNDTLYGDNRTAVPTGGNDILIGGAGKDSLTGGAGNDTFRFTVASDSVVGANADIITDFDAVGDDRIDVSALFGVAMGFRGAAAFSAAGQVRINDIAGVDLIVQVNTGGTLAADVEIRLSNTTLASMTASDLIL